MDRDERAWLIFFGILFLLLLIDFLVVNFLFLSLPRNAAFSIILTIENAVLLTMLLFSRAQKKRRMASDRIRIDLGLARNTFWLVLMGFAFLTMPISAILPDLFTKPLSAQEIADCVWRVLSGIISLIIGFDRWIATDSGIFYSLSHIKWAKIRSYEWKASQMPVLRLKIKNPGLSASWLDLEVPRQQVNSMEDLLSQHIAKEEKVNDGN